MENDDSSLRILLDELQQVLCEVLSKELDKVLPVLVHLPAVDKGCLQRSVKGSSALKLDTLRGGPGLILTRRQA